MKKKNFLCGLGAKLALAVVALTTVTFTSCEKEEFTLTFKENPAKIDVVANVFYINEKGETTQVTENVNVTVNGQDISKFELVGTPDIASTELTVVTKYGEFEAQTQKRTISAKAGSKKTESFFFFFNDTKSKLTIKAVKGETKIVKKFGKPINEGHGFVQDGSIWCENPTEFFMETTAEYTSQNKQVIVGEPSINQEEAAKVNQELLNNMIAGLEFANPETKKAKYTASAYSIFRAFVEEATTKTVYTIKNAETEAVIATVNTELTSGDGIQFEEKFHPNHAGDYHAGHGHGDKFAENEGGGIVFAD